jgi:phosphatidylglycerophosphate synthase
MYPSKATAVFAAMAAMALSVPDEHPFPRLGPANHITIVRAMIVALLAAAIGEPITDDMAAAAVTLAAIVATLDGVDGWLARRTRMASAFGARIDMETDALFILVLSVLMWKHGKAGAWVLAGGLLRYVFAAAAWPLPWMAGPLTPTMRAKSAAVAHMVGSSVALAPFVSWPQSAFAVGATLVTLTGSFAVDVRRLWRQRNM